MKNLLNVFYKLHVKAESKILPLEDYNSGKEKAQETNICHYISEYTKYTSNFCGNNYQVEWVLRDIKRYWRGE